MKYWLICCPIDFPGGGRFPAVGRGSASKTHISPKNSRRPGAANFTTPAPSSPKQALFLRCRRRFGQQLCNEEEQHHDDRRQNSPEEQTAPARPQIFTPRRFPELLLSGQWRGIFIGRQQLISDEAQVVARRRGTRIARTANTTTVNDSINCLSTAGAVRCHAVCIRQPADAKLQKRLF